ncbi:MAG: hypothetical protein GXO56_02570 [Chloroflexi bacterium]|nr:hypothetical protein [Chloroflexota bacterium]
MRRYRTLGLLFLLSALAYGLGLSIARYLGQMHAWLLAAQGLAWVWFLLGSGAALTKAFAATTNEEDHRRWLTVAFVLLAAAALETTLLLWQNSLPPSAAVLQVVLAVAVVFSTTPPLRLLDKGYGEILLAAGLSLLVPAFAYALQAAQLHRLLGMVGLPLFFLGLAALLAWDFPNYASNLKRERRSLLMRLDWRMAMRVHNLALLIGFLLLALDVVLGFPLGIALPCAIPFVAALLQVWMMQRIAQGARPPWGWLRTNAVMIVALTAYVLLLGFWRV